MATNKKSQVSFRNLFSRLYNDGPEALKATSETLVERNVQRRYQAAFDDAEGRIMSNNLEIQAQIAKLAACDVNVVIALRKENDDMAASQAIIADIYQELFGVALQTVDSSSEEEEA